MLHNKTALITGASGGIGQAITRLFLEQGAKVIASGSNEENLKQLQRELPSIKSMSCNLSDTEETKNLFTKAEEAFGPIDILINNAGVTRDKLAIMMSEQDFMSVIQVNLIATFLLSKAAIKSMLKRNSGRIINISSIVGITGNAGQANYAASKAGVIAMSKSLALEVAKKGITVNCVAPGFIGSAMTDKLNDRIKEKILEHIPQGKMGTGEDVAACCAFLASDASGYMTGQVLHPNGGMAMF